MGWSGVAEGPVLARVPVIRVRRGARASRMAAAGTNPRRRTLASVDGLGYQVRRWSNW